MITITDARVVVHGSGAHEGSLLGFFWHSWILTLRALRRWRRDPATLLESLIMPVALLFTLNIVLGSGISDVTGQSALYGSVPLIAMVAAMSGSMIGGVGLMRERNDGLLSRFWVLRINRFAGLAARLAADAVRIVATTAVILCVALLLGFRFQQGIVAAVAWLFVPVTFGLAFSMFVITLALFSARTLVVEATELIWGFLMFFSTGFVPLGQYPGWLQPFVEHQPVSCVVDTMRALALGGPVLGPLAKLLMWCTAIAALCATPMVFGFRRASIRG
jgi:ABC-2 type transport system permease protein